MRFNFASRVGYYPFISRGGRTLNLCLQNWCTHLRVHTINILIWLTTKNQWGLYISYNFLLKFQIQSCCMTSVLKSRYFQSNLCLGRSLSAWNNGRIPYLRQDAFLVEIMCFSEVILKIYGMFCMGKIFFIFRSH